MAGFEEQLNTILSNPDAMAQIANLAQSLNLGGGNGGESQTSPPPPAPAQSAQASGSTGGGLGGLAGLGDLLGSVDPKLIARLLPLVGELASGNDERMALLYALRPFLRPERRDKIEQAARAARLLHVGKKLLTALGENHV